MPTQEKVDAVAELADLFRASNAAVLTEYRGLSVSQLTRLRVALGDNATYAVVKNTLTKRAAADAARRAVMRCAPYNAPADKYEAWADVQFNFDPSQMF